MRLGTPRKMGGVVVGSAAKHGALLFLTASPFSLSHTSQFEPIALSPLALNSQSIYEVICKSVTNLPTNEAKHALSAVITAGRD